MMTVLGLALILPLACALPRAPSALSTPSWVTSNNRRDVDVYLGSEIGKTISIGSYP